MANALLYVSEDGLMASVPFQLFDTHGYPLTCQVDQLKGLGLKLNAVDWWLQAVISGKSPEWALDTLREAHADNEESFLNDKEWHSRMSILYTLAAKGQHDPECWESMLSYIRKGVMNG